MKKYFRSFLFLFMLVIISGVGYGSTFTLNNTQNRNEIMGTIGESKGDKLWGGYNNDGIPINIIQDSNRFKVSQDLIDRVIKTFPEGKDNSSIVDTGNVATNILVIEEADTEVWITFVFENAGNRNSLAYYTYKKGEKPSSITKANLIFPNSKGITRGDTVYLGKFEKDTVIGWLLFSNGWNQNQKNVNINSTRLFSNKEFNKNKFQQMAVFQYVADGDQKLILSFEDLERPAGDKDYNDLMFYVTSNKRLAPEEGEFIGDDWTTFSINGKIELEGSSYIDGLTGTNANALTGTEKPIKLASSTWIGNNGSINHEYLKIGMGNYFANTIIQVPPNWNSGKQFEFRIAVNNDQIQKLGMVYERSVDKTWFDIKIPSGYNLINRGSISTNENQNKVVTINESGKYSNVSINNWGHELNINIGKEDILLVVDELDLKGKINVNSSGGKLFLVINNSANIIGQGIFSDTEDVYIYYMGSSELEIGGNTKVDASIYLDKANLKLTGSGAVKGKEIIAKGASNVNLSGAGVAFGSLYALNADVNIGGSAKVEGVVTGGGKVDVGGGVPILKYIYAPKADINLLNSAKVEGFVIAGNLKLAGSSYIKRGDAKLEPPLWAEYEEEKVDLKKISLLEITDSGTSDFSAEDKGKLGSLTTMSMKQFVALRQELEGLYDAIYIGSGTYNSSGLTGNTSGNSGAHATRDILNDITQLKANEIKTNFIDKGYLVILHNDIFKGTKLNSNFSPYKDNIKENVKIVNNNSDGNILQILESHIKLRPEFNITNFNDLNGKTFDMGDTVAIRYDFTGELESVKLYIDSNFNHRIESNEVVAHGSGGSISYTVPRSLSGIRYFTVEALDKNGRRTIKNGYFYVKGETVQVNVLQVMNKNKTGSLLNTNNMNQSFLSSDKNEKDYEINITVIDIDYFNQTEYKNINGKYGMIIFGFADSYGNSNGSLSTNAKSELDKFIATGQSVMFTHDMIFQNSPTWSSYKDIFGQILPEHNLGHGAPQQSTTTKKINDGLLTMYPFNLGESITVASTHNQYFTLDLENPNVIPWYNLIGGTRDDVYDAYHHYYTYSIGNLTFSGTGHTPIGFPASEQQLFVNTMFRAFIGSNHAPRITVESPTINDWILGQNKIQFEFMVEDFDIGDNTSKVEVFINNNSIYSNNLIEHGVWIKTESNNYIKGQMNIIKIVAEDKQGARIEEIIKLYIPDDDIQINFLNPKENYLQTNDGIIVVFEIESKYKIPKKDSDGNIIEHKLAELKIPKMTINFNNKNLDTESDKTELVLTSLILDENDARKESIDKGELLVKKYQVKIQHDLSIDSIYKQIIDSTKVKLTVDLETNTEKVEEKLTIKKEKEVEITKPIVNKVSIKNLSAKIFFESLLDKYGNKISGMDNIYAEEIAVQGSKVETDIYVKQGDEIEIILEYEDKYLGGLSNDDIKKLINLDNGFIESSKIEINTSGEKITATYTLKFKNEVTFNDEKVEFSLKISDQNGGRAELDKIILKTSKYIGEFAIDLIDKNVVEDKNYIGNSHSYGFKLTNQVEDISNIGAYLIAFEYDWNKSDLTSEPSKMPKNIIEITSGSQSKNYFYFVSKEKEINLTDRIDGEYKVTVIPLDKSGKNSTGKNTLEEILKSVTFGEESLTYYIDTIAPKVENVEIKINRSWRNLEEKVKEKVKDLEIFNNNNRYKSGDTVTLNFSVEDLNPWKVEVKEEQTNKIIYKQENINKKEFSFELPQDITGGTYSILSTDKAENTNEYNGGNKVTFEIIVDNSEPKGVEVGIIENLTAEKDNVTYKFISREKGKLTSKGTGQEPIYIVAKTDKGTSYFGKEMTNNLLLKDININLVGTQGDQELTIYSFAPNGNFVKTIENVVVDNSINDGRTKITKELSSSGVVELELNTIKEYVGLASFRIVNASVVSRLNGEIYDGREITINNKENPRINKNDKENWEFTNPEVNIAGPGNHKLKIILKDKLGNTKAIDYIINITSNIKLIGTSENARNKESVESTIEIDNKNNINIKGRSR